MASDRAATAEVLAEALGLRVERRRAGDPLAEVADEHEVEGPQVGQLVAVDRSSRRSRGAAGGGGRRSGWRPARRSRRRRGPRRRRWRCRPCRRSGPRSAAPSGVPRFDARRRGVERRRLDRSSTRGGPVGAGSMRIRVPSSSTTTWSISSAGTSAGQYTPYAWAGPRQARREEPGDAGQRQLDRRRREGPADRPLVGRLDRHVQQPARALLVGAVAGHRHEAAVSIETPSARRRSSPPMPSTSALVSQSALASWSRPVSTNVMRLRKPPS